MADVEKPKQYEETNVSHGEYKSSFQAEGVGEIQQETVRGLNSRHIQFLALGTHYLFKSAFSSYLIFICFMKLTTNWVANRRMYRYWTLRRSGCGFG